ncbi:hypothetical protein F1728_02965 [Gimesia benthica]|uniref:Uncharacterized protein n=1 Tax=Gimesia benthica TaxID=2608982 RepID=A0A6I6A9N0_9PLAN|nr:hypothetical protein [Gimesia benthica]QGQ21711.1 hypothetical protein F1728_02965 [Gimesia benthica]
MNDRTHFFLSCGILVLVVSLALRPQPSEFLSPVTAQNLTIQQETSLESIHRFLEIEEGLATVSLAPAELDLAEVKTVRLPSKPDRREFIPMNVVPLQEKQDPGPSSASAAVPAQKPQVSSPVVKRISSQENRQLRQFESNASDLIDQSYDSFSRGLMTLSDYQLALNVAYQTRINVADLRDAKNARVRILSEKQALLEKAVEQLQMMNQPAAQGWFGDVVHARLILAQNQYEIAVAAEKKDQMGFALREINRLSDQYHSVRKQELMVGAADLNEYRRASRSVFVANLETNSFDNREEDNGSNLADYIRRLERIQENVDLLSERGAGLGRKDLVELSRAQLAYVQGNSYRHQKDERMSRMKFEQSRKHAQEAWEVRMNDYYPRGTSDLHELTSAWIMWRSADAELKQSETTKSSETDRELQAGLDQMLNLTGQIQDRRGRMASDISLVYCLKDAELLAQLKQKSE